MSARSTWIFALLLAAAPCAARGGYPPGDRWYQNPLGLEPVALHTSRGLVLPAAAAGLALLLTRAEPTAGPRLSTYAQAGAAAGYKSPYTSVFTEEVGLLWHPRPWLALGAELAAYQLRDAFNGTAGLAVRPMIRWYPVHTGPFRLFLESGGGLLLTADEFPAASDADARVGLRLNGATRYGVGAEVQLGSGWHLVGGVRHLHVSNGNVRGEARNPSHDSNGVFLGAGWRLR